MIFRWFKIFNLTEFLALDLPSRMYTYELQNMGVKDFLVTRGNAVSVLHEDEFLIVELNGYNPFVLNGHAVYRDENDDVWFGFTK